MFGEFLVELAQTVHEAPVLSCTVRLDPLYYWRALWALSAQSKKEGVWEPESQDFDLALTAVIMLHPTLLQQHCQQVWPGFAAHRQSHCMHLMQRSLSSTHS